MNAPVLTISVPPSTRSLRFVLSAGRVHARRARRARRPACRSRTTRSGAGSPTRRTSCPQARGSRRGSRGTSRCRCRPRRPPSRTRCRSAACRRRNRPTKRMTTRSRCLVSIEWPLHAYQRSMARTLPIRTSGCPNASALGFGAVFAQLRSIRGRRRRSGRLRTRAAAAADHARDRARRGSRSAPPLVTPGERMSYRAAAPRRRARDVRLRGRRRHRPRRQAGDRRAEPREGGRHRVRWSRTSTTRSRRGSTSRPAGRCAGRPTSSRRTARTRSAPRRGSRTARTTRCRSIFHLNDEPPKPEPQDVSMPDVWDFNAFLIALRAWEGAGRHDRRPPRCFAAASCGTSR